MQLLRPGLASFRMWQGGITLLALLLFLPGAASALELSEQTLQIDLKDDHYINDFCTKLNGTLSELLRAQTRFNVIAPNSKAKTLHRLRLNCNLDSVEIAWDVRRGGSWLSIAEFTLNRVLTKQAQSSQLALLVMKEIEKRLMWDGEVSATGSLTTPWTVLSMDNGAPRWLGVIKPEPNEKLRAARLRISLGATNSENLGQCLPLEVGTVGTKGSGQRGQFNTLGYGVVLHYENFASYAEVVYTKGYPSKDTPLFTRYIAPTEIKGRLKAMQSDCEEMVGLESGGALDDLLLNSIYSFSTEAIELNGINQRLGFNLFALHTSNGYKIPLGLGVYLDNRVVVGDFLNFELKYMRPAATKNFEPAVAGTAVVPQFNIGEAFFGIPFNSDPWRISPEIGVFFAKINIPYDPSGILSAPQQTTVVLPDGTPTPSAQSQTVTESLPSRSQVLNPAFALSSGYQRRTISAGARLSFSHSHTGTHFDFDANANLQVTKTWYIGADLYVLTISKSTSGEPGATMPAIGGHIGFDLQRSRR